MKSAILIWMYQRSLVWSFPCFLNFWRFWYHKEAYIFLITHSKCCSWKSIRLEDINENVPVQATKMKFTQYGQLQYTNYFVHRNSLMAHNWQKWRSRFLTCPCHKIYREEAVGLKSSSYTLNNKIFVNIWNLGQFCKKKDILSITALLKFKSKNPFAHIWHI